MLVDSRQLGGMVRHKNAPGRHFARQKFSAQEPLATSDLPRGNETRFIRAELLGSARPAKVRQFNYTSTGMSRRKITAIVFLGPRSATVRTTRGRYWNQGACRRAHWCESTSSTPAGNCFWAFHVRENRVVITIGQVGALAVKVEGSPCGARIHKKCGTLWQKREI
jgi:hypothetical protein